MEFDLKVIYCHFAIRKSCRDIKLEFKIKDLSLEANKKIDYNKKWSQVRIVFFMSHGWSDTWFYYRPINAHF